MGEDVHDPGGGTKKQRRRCRSRGRPRPQPRRSNDIGSFRDGATKVNAVRAWARRVKLETGIENLLATTGSLNVGTRRLEILDEKIFSSWAACYNDR